MEVNTRTICLTTFCVFLLFNVADSLRCRYCAGQLHDTQCNDTYLCQDQEYCYRVNYYWDGYYWAAWGCVDGFQLEDDEICGDRLYGKNPRRDKCAITLCNDAHECNSSPRSRYVSLWLLSAGIGAAALFRGRFE